MLSWFVYWTKAVICYHERSWLYHLKFKNRCIFNANNVSLFLLTYIANSTFYNNVYYSSSLFFPDSAFQYPSSWFILQYLFITRRWKSMLCTNNAKYIWIRMTNVLNGFDRIGILRDKPFTIRRNVIGFLTILFGLVFSNIYGKGNWNS